MGILSPTPSTKEQQLVNAVDQCLSNGALSLLKNYNQVLQLLNNNRNFLLPPTTRLVMMTDPVSGMGSIPEVALVNGTWTPTGATEPDPDAPSPLTDTAVTYAAWASLNSHGMTIVQLKAWASAAKAFMLQLDSTITFSDNIPVATITIPSMS